MNVLMKRYIRKISRPNPKVSTSKQKNPRREKPQEYKPTTPSPAHVQSPPMSNLRRYSDSNNYNLYCLANGLPTLGAHCKLFLLAIISLCISASLPICVDEPWSRRTILFAGTVRITSSSFSLPL